MLPVVTKFAWNTILISLALYEDNTYVSSECIFITNGVFTGYALGYICLPLGFYLKGCIHITVLVVLLYTQLPEIYIINYNKID